MPKTRVAVSLESKVLKRLDRLVARSVFVNRSQAIESALEEKIKRMDRRRFVEECSKLDPVEEQALAEEGLERDLEEWPEY